MEKNEFSLIAAIVRRAVLECIAAGAVRQVHPDDPQQIFQARETHALKQEIIAAGRKLWERQYVDGNGGNISFRISPQYILCTPTLCSKADLTVEDVSLCDLENTRICGDRAQTSEILLHIEIYKAVPAARAVIHCHPPYATAHAVAGVIPQGNLIPEQEIFVGPVAMAPYETPGTRAFAQTVLPYVKNHNTILLANHGVVCWADTVTHAEWFVEVVENYCKIVTIASQLRPQLPEIPPEKIQDLLVRKKKMGLPDPRLATEYERAAAAPESAQPSYATAGQPAKHGPADSDTIDRLVRRLSAEVVAFLNGSE